MHFSHEVLYAIVAFLAGSLMGTVFGFCLFGAWLAGWIFPVTVPDHLASNDTLGMNGKPPRSHRLENLPFAGADDYDFTSDEVGNVTYRAKIPYAGDGEG